MAARHSRDTASPSPSARLSTGRRSLRESFGSSSSRPPVDKGSLALTLDQIHSSASRSETLTTFDEFASPPARNPVGEGRAISSEFVPGGFTGLYSRIKASVTGARDTSHAAGVDDGNDGGDGDSLASLGAAPSVRYPRIPPVTTVSSPVILSTTSSRLQSPLSTNSGETLGLASSASNGNDLTPKITASSRRSTLQTSAAAETSDVAVGSAGQSSVGIRGNYILVDPYASADNERSSVDSTSRPQLFKPKSPEDPTSDGYPAPGRTSKQSGITPRTDWDDFTSNTTTTVAPAGLQREAETAVVLSDNDKLSESLRPPIATQTSTETILSPSLHYDKPPEELTSRRFSREIEKETVGHPAQPTRGAEASRNAPAKLIDESDGSRSKHNGTFLSQNSFASQPREQLQRSDHRPALNKIEKAATDASVSSNEGSRGIRSSRLTENETRRTVATPSRAIPRNRRKVLAREFWMRDENAKDCFYCGDAFSTFRRKHHCRTCGQIFDAKCTLLVQGRIFGQGGTLRLCKPCEAMIRNNEDDSSDFSDDEDEPTGTSNDPRVRKDERAQSFQTIGADQRKDQDHTKVATPTIGIPVSRRSGDTKRHSAVIEFEDQHASAWPSSSRSLNSFRASSSRPRSSSHRRHHSRHQHMRSLKGPSDGRAPFQNQISAEDMVGVKLPAFHNDSIIDPDLAPFMSDEGSSGDEQMSIFASLDGGMQANGFEPDRSPRAGLLGSSRKGKSRAGDRSVAGFSSTSRDPDNVGFVSKYLPVPSRKRALSVNSLLHPRLSPRRSRSSNLLRGFGINLSDSQEAPAEHYFVPGESSKVVRSSSMRGAGAPTVELNRASLEHVRKLLRQLLCDSGIERVTRWEKALIPILLKCTDDVDPDVHRGDDIDIRHYIKLKKIPGGKPGDTSYISGVVFTKNVALKSMRRRISQPRIVIVTFAIEYARHQQHFMSLEPVIAQEREYLRNIVSRIAALQPQVLLVQRNVAGLALQFLEEANITVVYNVKPSVLNAVSRCTKTRMISSVDRLAMDPTSLGSCSSFEVKTYLNNDLRKTYISLSGCQKELGCTIVLRGAELPILKKIKRITEFMCYVVYNLKLETCLMRDEFVLIPTTTDEGTLSLKRQSAGAIRDESNTANASGQHALVNGSAVQQNESEQSIGRDREVSEDGLGGLACNAPPMTQMGGTNSGVASDYITGRPRLPEDAHMPSFYSDVVEKHRTKILSASPFVKFMLPHLLMRAREQETRLAYLKCLRDQYDMEKEQADDAASMQTFELVKPEMVHTVVQKASKQVREFLHAVHNAEYDTAMHSYVTQKRQWETFISGTIDLFDPFSHQSIVILYSLVNTERSTPCAGPEIIAFGFYKEHDLENGFDPDCTLGQYVEDLCCGAGNVCGANGCDKRMFDHHRQYVHGEGQISIFAQKYPSKIRGMHNTILMWSCCRICGQETQVVPMSDNSWRYSLGKYFELSFWSSELHPRAGVCPHDIHRNHLRYFGFHNVAIRVQYDTIQLYEVIVPRPRLTWKVDSDLKLKNEQYLRIEEKLNKFMLSVKARVTAISVDNVVPEKADACRAEIDKLTQQANDEHALLLRILREKYMSSRFYEIIPLNRAMRAAQEKAIAWDETFAEFERTFFPSEKDIRRLAALQLRKMFLDRDESSPSMTSVEEGSESRPTELSSTTAVSATDADQLVLTPKPSKISAETAKDMMTSVVEEHSERVGVSNEEALSDDKQQDLGPVTMLTGAPANVLADEEVRHLDLAVPSSFSDTATLTGQVTPRPSGILSDGKPSPGDKPMSERETISLDAEVSEKIKSMRGSINPVTIPEEPPESRIPRPVEAMRRKGPAISPSLLRTQSQPSGMSPRDSKQSSAATIVSGTEEATPTTPVSRQADLYRAYMNEVNKPFERKLAEKLALGAFKSFRSSSQSLIPRSIPNKRFDTKVSALAKHFEQLSREFERERLRERRDRDAGSRQARANPLALSRPVVEVYRDAREAVQEQEPPEDDTQPSSAITQRTDDSTLGYSGHTGSTDPTSVSESALESQNLEDTTAETTETEDHTEDHSQRASDIEGDHSDTEQTTFNDTERSEGNESRSTFPPSDSSLDLSIDLPKHERVSVMKLLASFWSERSASGWKPLEYPLGPLEHCWHDSDIVLREDEPSSLIALALSHPDYLTELDGKLREKRSVSKGASKLVISTEAGPKLPSQVDDEAILERTLLGEKASHMSCGVRHGPMKAQCKIFYAESFDAIRKKCGVADRFVESLSRCLKWDSKGGKTKSLFLKTLDDRFVLKSLSRAEVDAFNPFAPNYFAFMSQTLFHGLPSVIAKMFGLFQVVIKNPATGVDFNWYMLVMENLFYDRTTTRRFDLKGSMRNRKVQSTGEQDEVLLDENLVDIIYESPIFVREHTSKLLQSSVWNDTLFLSKQNVMDYSIMAGFDEPKREIVVGIIDSIRTYTWDKKLESWIKDRGKNKPTITNPKDYRSRFRASISNYILLAPNCWHQFQLQQIQQRPVQLRPTLAKFEPENEPDAESRAAAVIS